jgi:unsaturated rhamnogalacturonyl hydrolase
MLKAQPLPLATTSMAPSQPTTPTLPERRDSALMVGRIDSYHGDLRRCARGGWSRIWRRFLDGIRPLATFNSNVETASGNRRARGWLMGLAAVVVVTAVGAGCGSSGGATPPQSGTGGGGGGSGGSAGTGGAAGAGGSGGASGSGGIAGTGGAGGQTGTGGADGGADAGGGGSGGSGGAGGSGGSGGSGGTMTTLPANSLAVRFANAVMSRWPDPSAITGQSAAWEYNHGIVLRGIEQVWRHTHDARYLTYIQRYADEFVDGTGTVNIPAAHSFDNIEPSVLLPFLYQQTGQAKYHTAADNIRARYDSIPKNADGGFWHKQADPNQMWLDSIYMGEPFLARYGAVFGTCTPFCANTVSTQILLIAQHVRDTSTGLLYHAWDDSPAGMKAAWADPTTGRSPIVWGRALGWYAMALVDVLPDLPANVSGRDQMLAIFTGIASAVKAAQDPSTGLWHQVVDMGSKSDDFLETSASGMFVYALKQGVNLGYIDSSYLVVASKGWQGLQTKVTMDASGLPTITGAVQGMGVQVDYATYVNQATLSNSSHGLCAILLAAAEMEAM